MIADAFQVGAVPDDDQDGKDDLDDLDGHGFRLQADVDGDCDGGNDAGQGGHPPEVKHDHKDTEGQEKVEG